MTKTRSKNKEKAQTVPTDLCPKSNILSEMSGMVYLSFCCKLNGTLAPVHTFQASSEAKRMKDNCCIFYSAQCHSNDDVTREVACQAIEHLAKQMSDAGAVEKLLALFFNVING